MEKSTNSDTAGIPPYSFPSEFQALFEAYLTKLTSEHQRRVAMRLQQKLGDIYSRWRLSPAEILDIVLEYEAQDLNLKDLDRLVNNPRNRRESICHLEEVIKILPGWNSRMLADAIDIAPLERMKMMLECYDAPTKRRTPQIAMKYCAQALEDFFEKRLPRHEHPHIYRNRIVIALLEACFPTWEPNDSEMAYKEMRRRKQRPLPGSNASYIRAEATLVRTEEGNNSEDASKNKKIAIKDKFTERTPLIPIPTRRAP